MNSLIEQIQRGSIDRSVPVSMLLLKVKLAASKLRVTDLGSWVDDELNGYRNNPTQIPSYREVSGIPMYMTSMVGWRPIGGDVEVLRCRYCKDAIATLESLTGKERDGGTLSIPFPDRVRLHLIKHWGGDEENCLQVALFIDRSAIEHILNSVRQLVL